jgi:hypothetical protein
MGSGSCWMLRVVLMGSAETEQLSGNRSWRCQDSCTVAATRADSLESGGDVDQGWPVQHGAKAEADRWADRPEGAQITAGERGVGGDDGVQILGSVPLARPSRVRPRVRTPGNSRQIARSSSPPTMALGPAGRVWPIAASPACCGVRWRMRAAGGLACTIQRGPERQAWQVATWTSSNR